MLNSSTQNRFEWSHSMTFKLIELYKKHPCLWNPNNEKYKNRAIRDRITMYIAKQFSTNTNEIKRKIHNLRNQYNQESLRSMKYSENGRFYKSKWMYYDVMKFTKNYNSTANKTSIDSTETDLDISYETEMKRSHSQPKLSNIKIEKNTNRQQTITNLEIKQVHSGDQTYFDTSEIINTDDTEQDTESYEIIPASTTHNKQSNIIQSVIKRRKFQMHDQSFGDNSSEHNGSSVLLFDESNQEYSTTSTSKDISDASNAVCPDELTVFGKYVANELRCLREPKHVRKLKRMIQTAILEVIDMDDTED